MNAFCKPVAIRSQKLRRSAQGVPCTVQIPGVCIGNPQTSVLAHLPDESHGIARKADDFCACIACAACHDVIDRRGSAWKQISDEDREFYLRRALVRTWRYWIQVGLVKVA